MATKVDVERFSGQGDFSLWKRKMKALMIHHKCAKAIEDPENLPETITAAQKLEWSENAHSLITLHLADKVLRLVGEEETAIDLWKKLEKLFLAKSLPNKILLKERFFGFKSDPSKPIEENLDSFVKITQDLADIGEKVDYENQAIILLNSLPESYNDVKSAIKYGRDSLDLDLVIDALRYKELDLKVIKKNDEALVVRGREEAAEKWKRKIKIQIQKQQRHSKEFLV